LLIFNTHGTDENQYGVEKDLYNMTEELLFFHTDTCVKCPTMHDNVKEVGNELSVKVNFIDANEIPINLQERMLKNNIFLTAVPSLVFKKNGMLKLLSQGKIIPTDELIKIVTKHLDVNEKPKIKLPRPNLEEGLHALNHMSMLLPQVRTTKGDIVPFDAIRIYESLLNETRLDEQTAFEVTFAVVQRIMSSRISWLSGPAIREMCNSILAEMGEIEARKKYTRLGIALADYKNFFADTDKENANQYKNPESIHSWAADKISAEYSLLNLVSEEEASAHLCGDIHIHMLRYFDMRPFCLDGSTKIMILSNNSMATIKAMEFDHFFENDESFIDVSDQELFFMTSKGPQRINIVTRKRSDPTMYKITTKRGKEIVTSKDHKIMVFNGSIPSEVRASDLKIGDKLQILNSMPITKNIEKINIIDLLMITCPQEILETTRVRNLRENLITIKQNQSITWEGIFQQVGIVNYPISWEHGGIPLFDAIKLIDEYHIDISNLEIGFEGSPYSLPAILHLDHNLLKLIGYFVSEGNYNINDASGNYNLVLTSKDECILDDMILCIQKSLSTFVTRSNIIDKTPQIFFGGKHVYILFRYVFGIEPMSEFKSLSSLFYNLSDDHLKSLLSGLYTGDGHVSYKPKSSSIDITYTSKSRSLIDFLSIIFGTRNIRHTIMQQDYEYHFPPYHGNGVLYRLKIYGYKNIKRASSIIEFSQSHKQKKIHDFLKKHRSFHSKFDLPFEVISKISLVEPTHPFMYDFSLDGDGTWEQHTFYAEGILVHNCQESDLRMILKNGLPPIGWSHSAVSKPASKAMVAVLHAAKWLGILQGEFAGGQGFDNFNVFLAPYTTGLSDDELDQLAQCFLFESNQIYAARGAQVPFTSISILPTVPKSLLEVPAVSFKGRYDGAYGDYVDETNRLAKAFARTYHEGDGAGKLFNFPKFEVKITKDWLDKYEDFYYLVNKTTQKFGQPYYLNQACGWMSDEVHSQCCRIILDQEKINQDQKEFFDWSEYYINMGSLQSISINLPRLGFLCNGDIDLFYELLKERMNLAKGILLKKLAVIKKRMNSRVIPLCAGVIKNPNGVETQLLDFRRQSLSIGIIGLNECVKGITEQELHESPEAFGLGANILQRMSAICEEFTNENGIRFSLWEQPAESTAGRFALSDLKHYPKQAIPLGVGKGVYYTNSNHINYAADISLDERIQKQAEYHPIVQGGVISHVWLGDSKCDEEALWKLTKNIALKTKTGYFAFTFDFTQCVKCGIFSKGLHDKCPNCNAEEKFLEWWSRITGYYARVKRFNNAKISEVHDRKRYGIIMS